MSRELVILIQPRISEGVSNFRVPLSLLAISRFILQDGLQVKIFDSNVENVIKNIAPHLEKALCVGISSMTGYQIRDGLKISQYIKRQNKNIPIIWGGWHPSILPEQTVQNEFLDCVVRGQGEATFRELVDSLRRGSNFEGILGLTWRLDGKIISNPDRPLIDIRTFPPLPYELIEVRKYLNTELNECTLNYISSQGCPHHCGFCADAIVYKRKWSALEAGQVLSELENLVEGYGVNGIIFEDSNFFVDMERVKAICRGIVQKQWDLKWHADGRIEHILKFDKELFALLKKSGCKRLLVGAESGSQEVLDMINKQTEVGDILRFAQVCSNYDIMGRFSFMVGFSHEPAVDLHETIDLIKEIKQIDPRHEILLFFYTPYPGTPLYKMSLENGLKEPQGLEDWAYWQLSLQTTPWINNKYKKIVEGAISYFALAFPKKKLNGKRFFNFFHLFFSKLALYRCNHIFFRFPVDIKIYEMICKSYMVLKNINKAVKFYLLKRKV